MPQGKYHENKEEKYRCNNNDYKHIITYMIKFYADMEKKGKMDKVDLTFIEINNYDKPKLSVKNLIPFFILLIPLCIYLISMIYRAVFIREKDNNEDENENKRRKRSSLIKELFDFNANLE